MRATARTTFIILAVAATACTPPKGEPSLTISLMPRTVSDATPVTVHVVGTTGDGKVGTGTVKITSARGSLTEPASVEFDQYGSAVATLICDPTMEPGCAMPVRVVAEWTSDGVPTSIETRLNSTPAVTGDAGTGNADPTGRKMWFNGVIFRNADPNGAAELSAYAWHPVDDINTPEGLSASPGGTIGPLPDRKFYYLKRVEAMAAPHLFVVVPEPLSDVWVTADLNNDIELPQPCGTGLNDFQFFGIFPDNGAFAFGCLNTNLSSPAVRTFRDSRDGGAFPLELGWDGHLIAQSNTGYSLWKGGQEVAMLPWPYLRGNGNGIFFHATAVPDGFIVNADCEVAHISFDGGVDILGHYSNPMPETATPDPDECCRAIPNPEGIGYLNSTRTDVIGTCQYGGINRRLWNIAKLPGPFRWTGADPQVWPSFLGQMVYR